MNDSNAQHGGHPSNSIPDAAYPNDSPFRPGATSQIMNPPPASPSPQYPGPPPSHFGASINPTESPWSPIIPQSPPPPYDPSRPPAIYSPLAPPPLSSPPSMSSPPPQYPPSTPWPYQQGSIAGSSIHGAPYKLGPRARKRRKLQMITMAVCAMMIFFLVLIMGILMGVVKVQWNNNDDED
ncbi:hypothetical protein FHETE_2733 [Fusarium heterosporum]|uniref:Uncharacterized protein n=1 Tax=Fusarium heterosporum TaxID=42747 RepID=A0A8H5TSZ4_FUSHE|nr:hypothetical protein FHETE_2733 [Fusarium heterosporum]